MEDSGALPLEMDVTNMNMGDVVEIYPYQGVAKRHGSGEGSAGSRSRRTSSSTRCRRAGAHQPHHRPRAHQQGEGEPRPSASDIFRLPSNPPGSGSKGFTLAQKMVGKACGVDGGILPGTYCEPKMTTVGSQDTTGPMTRDELKDLACLGFSSDLVMQSFCHTAAYPKPVDVVTRPHPAGFHPQPRRREPQNRATG